MFRNRTNWPPRSPQSPLTRRPVVEEHPVPGQNPPRPDAFLPAFQPDAQSAQAALQARTPPQPSLGALPFVVATYESRFLNGIDFTTFTGGNALDNTLTGVSGAAPANQWASFYTVPAGFVAVMKSWAIVATPVYTGGDAGTAVVNADGSSNFWSQIDILINGTPVNQNSGMKNANLAFGSASANCFIIANENDIIQIRGTGLGTSPLTPPNTNAQFQQFLVQMYGNLLLSDGLNQIMQVGGRAPVPITQG